MSRLFIILFLTLNLIGYTQNDQNNNSRSPLMGYNAHMSDAPNWNDPSLNSKLFQLHPNTLRYPGGSNSFYWDWKKGWTISYSELLNKLNEANFTYKGKKINNVQEFKVLTKQNRTSNPFWRQVYRYNAKTIRLEKLSEFANAVKTHNSKAVFTLNLITSTVENEIEMLNEAKKNNIKIEYIELGNEINSENLITKHFYPNADAYVDTCINWSKKIFEIFPEIKIGVVGGDKNKRLKDWNKKLIDAINTNFKSQKNQFYFILHYYPHFKNPIYNFNISDQYKQLVAFPKLDLDRRLNWWNWKHTKELGTWITEYNLIEPQPYSINNKWVHALFTSNLINQIYSLTNASMFHYHSIGSKRFPVFAAINMMDNQMKITTSGLATSLWNKFTKNTYNFKKIESNGIEWTVKYDSKFNCNCPNNPKRPTSIKFETLQIYSSQLDDKRQFLITNLSDKHQNFNLSEYDIKQAYVEQYFGQLNDKQWQENSLTAKGIIEIPPYSINFLRQK